MPRAVFSVFPAGRFPDAPLPELPGSVRVLVQVGDRDTVAGRAAHSRSGPGSHLTRRARKRFEVVHSGPSLAATHAAPKLSTPGARTAFWKPLDLLISSRDDVRPG